MNLIQRLRELRFQLFYALLLRKKCNLTTLGNACPWTLCCDTLGPTSRILCAGAGNDISFELELLERFKSQIVLLDPSPTGIATVERASLRGKGLVFLPVGLAAYDGYLGFQTPDDPKEGSFRRAPADSVDGMGFPCRSIRSLQNEFQWESIDLLKIDIEGSEYEVLDQIIKYRIPIRQICVEFHHGPAFGYSRYSTVRQILALKRAGYDLLHRVNWDHTFMLRSPLREIQ